MDPAIALTAQQFLSQGLRLVNVDARRLGMAAKLRKFRSFYGPHPNHCVYLWNDLFTTNIAAARVDIADADLFGFFAALRPSHEILNPDSNRAFLREHHAVVGTFSVAITSYPRQQR